jgi:AAA15 family ATPase/GTPase
LSVRETSLTNSIKNIVYSKQDLKKSDFLAIEDFLIYTVSTTFLRGIHTESRKEPLGINGEGLDVLLASFDKEEIEKLKYYNYLIGWLEDFFVDNDDVLKLRGYKLNRSKSVLYFKDRFMMRKNNVFSAENSNEGILHILFYLALMISKRTPKFFAIDNIESSLNPILCREIITVICNLVKENQKQVLITTHNPAILDGLNLNDDDIRLFEVYRNNSGHTKARRIKLNPETKPEKIKLSELWTRNYIGAGPNI